VHAYRQEGRAAEQKRIIGPALTDAKADIPLSAKCRNLNGVSHWSGLGEPEG